MENETMKRRWRRVWLLAIPVIVLGLWLALGGVIYATSLRSFVIPSKSMAPTIAPNDRVIVDTRSGQTPKRGEIWVFTLPNGSKGVKRVVGLPGETIEVAGGRLVIDSKPLAEPYLVGPIGYSMPPVELKSNEFFVLGDNRNASFDSHVWGPAPKSGFIGRVEFRHWPPARLGGLP
jgi:signal peptidase I